MVQGLPSAQVRPSRLLQLAGVTGNAAWPPMEHPLCSLSQARQRKPTFSGTGPHHLKASTPEANPSSLDFIRSKSLAYLQVRNLFPSLYQSLEEGRQVSDVLCLASSFARPSIRVLDVDHRREEKGQGSRANLRNHDKFLPTHVSLHGTALPPVIWVA